MVLFVDDVDAAAQAYAKLFNKGVEKSAHFNKVALGDLEIGFHPADDKAPSGSVVPYFKTNDLELAITNAATEGFVLYRGPITIKGEKIAQLRNERDLKIGFVQKL